MEFVVSYVIGVVVIVVGLALSIALHELGHFLPARRFGIRVSQFMIGFGPTLFSRRRGETEFGIKAIPLGGYIAMAGMYPPARVGSEGNVARQGILQGLVMDARTASAETIHDGEEHRSFYQLPVLKRIVIMLGGPFANLLIAVVLYAVVLMGFGVPQPSTTVGSVLECVIPASSSQTECRPDDPLSPAASAGLLPGDRVVRVGGVDVTQWSEVSEAIRAAAGTSLSMVVERDGEPIQIETRPLLTERFVFTEAGEIAEDSAGEPILEPVGFLGLVPASEIVRQPAAAVLPAVGDNIVRVSAIIINLPERMVAVANAAFGAEERDPNGPVSVVGVGRIAGEIATINSIPVLDRLASLVGLIASLNVALFVFNLLPLMPLDGGHVAGALWEAVRRRFAALFGRPDPGPFDAARWVPITLVVVVLLGSMSALLVYADIVKPISIL